MEESARLDVLLAELRALGDVRVDRGRKIVTVVARGEAVPRLMQRLQAEPPFEAPVPPRREAWPRAISHGERPEIVEELELVG